ncbi:hypothetical protein MMC18_002374 [Xylographa bjoerkii]|nr:hypothetical protein [Xylographa bjoerkii]
MEQVKQPGVPSPRVANRREQRRPCPGEAAVYERKQSPSDSPGCWRRLRHHLCDLRLAIPDGHVTAVDLNPDILPRARAVAEMAGVKNIEFQQGDAYKLPFADATFDIAYCHQMLTHLKAPWDALREMLRVTKPAGIVAAREGDLETECVWPDLSGLIKFHKRRA